MDNSQAHDRERQAYRRGLRLSTLPMKSFMQFAADSSQTRGRIRQAHCRVRQSRTRPLTTVKHTTVIVKNIAEVSSQVRVRCQQLRTLPRTTVKHEAETVKHIADVNSQAVCRGRQARCRRQLSSTLTDTGKHFAQAACQQLRTALPSGMSNYGERQLTRTSKVSSSSSTG